MKKISFLLLIIFLHLIIGCSTQDNEFRKFDNLFNECITDTLKTSTLSFDTKDSILSGKRVTSNFYHFFKFPEEFKEYQNDSTKTLVTALKKISLDNYTAYFITFSNSEIKVPHFTCLYLCNNKTGRMNTPVTVKYDYGSEGTESVTESWIFDFNKDGKKDIITRTYQCNLLGSDAHIGHFVDTLTINIWADSSFKFIVSDNYKELKKKLKIDCTCECGMK